MKLLIVDDHQIMRNYLRALLAGVADEVIEAVDGTTAIALYAERRPDWVVMDLYMKPVGGLAALREIKARFPDARIIIVTGLDHGGLRTVVLQAGAHAFVLKQNLHELHQFFPPRDPLGGHSAPRT